MAMVNPPPQPGNQTDERLRLAVRASGLGIYDHDHQTGALFWSPEMHRICGTQADSQVTLQTYVDLLHPEDRERIEAAIARAHEPSQGGEFEVEHRVVRHDGEVRWVAARSQTTFEGEGNRRRPARTVGVIVDVTERRQREEALYFSDNRLQEAARVAKFGIFDHDHATDRIYWSAEQRANYGWGPDEEVTLAKFVSQVYEADRERVWAAVQRAHDPNGNGRFDIEHRIVQRGGQVRWLTTRSQSFFEGEGASRRLMRTIGAVLDVTERKNAEDELRKLNATLEQRVAERTAQLEHVNQILKERTEHAEAATRAKSAFLANMSHEIRTPLNGVLGMAGLLRRSGVTPEQAAYLDKIETSGRHLLKVINGALDLSAVEAGKLRLDCHDFDLRDVVRNAVGAVSDRARAKQLDLRVELGDAPEHVRGDSTRLTQALINYLDNAVKFTEQGQIVLQCCVLESGAGSDVVRFEVTDTGIGLSPSEQCRIFEPFEQADVSTTRKYGGTGLGLAITKRIAELMDGEAGVSSAIGEGSSFWLTARLGRRTQTLPARGAAKQETAEAILTRDYRGAQLLLVEDNPINQEVAKLLLQSVGLSVDVADNGAAAVRRAAATDYALILMDMQMPEMDGLQAAAAIRALPGRAAVPILAITANAFDKDRTRCLDAGMNDFLPKPFEPVRLFDTLLKWLQERGPCHPHDKAN